MSERRSGHDRRDYFAARAKKYGQVIRAEVMEPSYDRRGSEWRRKMITDQSSRLDGESNGTA